MAPKRVDAAMAGRAGMSGQIPRCSKKVSQNIFELALDAMQNEVDVARKQEQHNIVLSMLDKSSNIADRCYAISLAEQRKAEVEFSQGLRQASRCSGIPERGAGQAEQCLQNTCF